MITLEVRLLKADLETNDTVIVEYFFMQLIEISIFSSIQLAVLPNLHINNI